MSPFVKKYADSQQYHSHYSAQYAGGASGPIVIYGPATACYDEDIGPVMLTDWFEGPQHC
jgi:hypothetical protein